MKRDTKYYIYCCRRLASMVESKQCQNTVTFGLCLLDTLFSHVRRSHSIPDGFFSFCLPISSHDIFHRHIFLFPSLLPSVYKKINTHTCLVYAIYAPFAFFEILGDANKVCKILCYRIINEVIPIFPFFSLSRAALSGRLSSFFCFT